MSWLAALVEARGGLVLPADFRSAHHDGATAASADTPSETPPSTTSASRSPQGGARPSEVPHGVHEIRAQIDTVLCRRCRRPLHDPVERWVELCGTCEAQPEYERDRHADRLLELSRGELDVGGE